MCGGSWGRTGEAATELERILIVDDDHGWRALIADVLQKVGLATYEADSGEAALDVVKSERPALAVVDVVLPGISGYEVCRHIKDTWEGAVPVIFVSGARVESVDRVGGLLVGADDYLVKPFDPGELAARVRRLLPDERSEGTLTARELEVLTLVADGLSQVAIGAKLFISPKTVGKHVEHILSKLGVHNRAEAVAIGLRRGLIRPRP